jgi:hypothetical protein
MPDIGARYRYAASTGLAAQARIADPDVGDELASEMQELDMHPDTVVTVRDYDLVRDLIVVEWADRSGNPRMTSIEADQFDDQFTQE